MEKKLQTTLFGGIRGTVLSYMHCSTLYSFQGTDPRLHLVKAMGTSYQLYFELLVEAMAPPVEMMARLNKFLAFI